MAGLREGLSQINVVVVQKDCPSSRWGGGGGLGQVVTCLIIVSKLSQMLP